jgi:hypothetical protein
MNVIIYNKIRFWKVKSSWPIFYAGVLEKVFQNFMAIMGSIARSHFWPAAVTKSIIPFNSSHQIESLNPYTSWYWGRKKLGSACLAKHGAGSTIICNGREPKSCLCQAFNFKLGWHTCSHFVTMTFIIMTLSIATFSKMRLSFKSLFVTFSTNGIQHKWHSA